MTRTAGSLALVVWLLASPSGLRAGAAMPQAGEAQTPAPAAPAAPTFSRDVAPVLYRNCVTCHREGESAPMSLVTYQDARPWARAIRDRVASGVMPPWHAEAPPGTFENERRLTAAERDMIVRWVDAGSPQGDISDLPAAPQFAEGWRIGRPDAIFEMLEDYAVPARGTVEYENFYIPTNFTTAQWLQAIEVRPGNRKLVHHVLVYYQAPLDGPRAAPALRMNPDHNRLPVREQGLRPARPSSVPSRLIATYAPGTDPQVFRDGTALRLDPGGVLHLQLHYSTSGTAGTDRTRVGMVLAGAAPAQEIRASNFLNATLSIPAGATDHRVDTEVGFLQDALVWGLFPHTHVRGKRWSYSLVGPDGVERPILSVPKYDFNWQTYYMFKEPLAVPKGARIVSSAWYDNSAANRSNPDASAAVKWGDQTWEEMQYTGILYSVR
jgi:mono/diheme cytochrome c family protein